MNKLAKKVIIFSMIGLMQVGLGASVIEASPKHYDKQYNHRYEECNKDKHKGWHNEREHRIAEERARHEREMERRHYESEREYRERQEREKEHHEEVMRTLGGLALLAIILNNN